MNVLALLGLWLGFDADWIVCGAGAVVYIQLIGALNQATTNPGRPPHPGSALLLILCMSVSVGLQVLHEFPGVTVGRISLDILRLLPVRLGISAVVAHFAIHKVSNNTLTGLNGARYQTGLTFREYFVVDLESLRRFCNEVIAARRGGAH